jgi:hypothetical protein
LAGGLLYHSLSPISFFFFGGGGGGGKGDGVGDQFLFFNLKCLEMKFRFLPLFSKNKICHSGKLSWEQVLRYTSLRKRYISLYVSLLKSDLSRAVVDDNKDIEELDHALDIELILQWRYFLAINVSMLFADNYFICI